MIKKFTINRIIYKGFKISHKIVLKFNQKLVFKAKYKNTKSFLKQ